MALSKPNFRDNPEAAPVDRILISRNHDGVRWGMFVSGSLFLTILSVITPFVGAFASSIISPRSLSNILLLRETVNIVGALAGIVVLFLLTGSPRFDMRRLRDVVLLTLIVSLFISAVRLILQPLVGLHSDELGSRWLSMEIIIAVIFAVLLLTVMILVAQRYTLVDAQVILRDEARRALEEDHESLRVRVFDHLHGTVQSELLVTRIRLLDIARELYDEKAAAAIVKEAGNIGRIHEMEIRRLAHVMVASGIDISLGEALRQLALACEGLCEVKINLYEDFSHFDLSLEDDARATIRLAIFRIVEECVNNALRHGKAQKITIDLGAQQHTNGHIVFIQVSNVGDLPAGETREGAGLRVMRARASLYNGSVKTSVLNGVFTLTTELDIRN